MQPQHASITELKSLFDHAREALVLRRPFVDAEPDQHNAFVAEHQTVDHVSVLRSAVVMSAKLAEYFVAHASPATENAPAELEAELVAILEKAKAANPGVKVAPERFIAYLAPCVPAGTAPGAIATAVHTADLYLACACAMGDSIALRLFDARSLKEVGAAVRRIDDSAAFADEVCQSVRERLLAGPEPRIATYDGSGPLAGWVRTAAVRIAISLVKKRRMQPHGESRARSLEDIADTELLLIRERHGAQLKLALERAMAALRSEDRLLLRLYHLDGLTLETIGTMQRVAASTVMRRLNAARAAVLNDTKRQLRTLLQLSATSLDSLIDLVASDLSVSFRRLLEDPQT